MKDRSNEAVDRRLFLRRVVLGGAALAALPVLQACSQAPAPSPTAAPAKPAAAQAAPGAKPGDGPDPALIEASKKEGKLVWYSPTVEEDKVKYLEMFKEKYPWVNVDEYLRLQTGKLYAKVVPEMEQNVQSCDILTLSEIALALDFQKKGFYMQYESPASAAYDKKWKSDPVGHYVGSWINVAGIAWNTNVVKKEEAPKTWNDLLDPKWGNGAMNVKDSASGLQYSQYAMIAKLYGEEWWDKFAAQKPVAMAGTAQQYEKLIAGENKVNALAQQSTFVQKKLAGAPVDIVFPKEGIPYTPLIHGIVKNSPHPATAKLFIDWLIGEEGAKAIISVSKDYVTRPNSPAPELLPKYEELNVFIPDNWEKYIAEQPAWREKWNKITGV